MLRNLLAKLNTDFRKINVINDLIAFKEFERKANMESKSCVSDKENQVEKIQNKSFFLRFKKATHTFLHHNIDEKHYWWKN